MQTFLFLCIFSIATFGASFILMMVFKSPSPQNSKPSGDNDSDNNNGGGWDNGGNWPRIDLPPGTTLDTWLTDRPYEKVKKKEKIY